MYGQLHIINGFNKSNVVTKTKSPASVKRNDNQLIFFICGVRLINWYPFRLMYGKNSALLQALKLVGIIHLFKLTYVSEV